MAMGNGVRESSVVKLGTWGGRGGVAHDITVAPQRLESITFRHGMVVDSVAFSYRDKDKQLHAAGPWGGTGGLHEDTINLDASEYVTEVAGAVGTFGDVPHVIAWLKIVTNRATYGPFGHGEGTPFNIPVLNNGSIVGMFGRAGGYLDAVGFYILPF
ncbi:hypothetical protein PR202_gb20144 [Eleusine coracana subsp. coracana]|uniref:Jacalin-type lectin domain-containing protein n=1 Tax=Eleusine coracana subsp. coracana TaxID=191504 RepID=A0AAV5FA23_ELECO|nr:hypothetical protein PR202_gb20144 [Eleusine coracana subsp. coracana]